ncbi:MAG: hypothetical protein KBD60_00895 [Sterolibacterium sp.]|jgi:hypothetical protein|nr:hypothetical protein [Sterolibacterium sp.]
MVFRIESVNDGRFGAVKQESSHTPDAEYPQKSAFTPLTGANLTGHNQEIFRIG